jgi:hypothetical protein
MVETRPIKKALLMVDDQHFVRCKPGFGQLNLVHLSLDNDDRSEIRPIGANCRKHRRPFFRSIDRTRATNRNFS